MSLCASVSGASGSRTLASAHVIVDVQAELTAEHDAGLVPTDPTRVHDSREF